LELIRYIPARKRAEEERKPTPGAMLLARSGLSSGGVIYADASDVMDSEQK
jgi:hypothetical protein